MATRIPCPRCGAKLYPTDQLCVSCGQPIFARAQDPATARNQAAPENADTPAPESDAFSERMERIPRKVRRLVGAGFAVVAGAILYFSGSLLFCTPLIVLVGLAILWDANDSVKDRAMARRVAENGGDRTALQMELLRHSRPDRYVQTGRVPMLVKGFDGRLDSEKNDGEINSQN